MVGGRDCYADLSKTTFESQTMTPERTAILIDSLHTAICQAVTLLVQGKNYMASSVLRQSLADFPDDAPSIQEPAASGEAVESVPSVAAGRVDSLIDALLEAKSGEQIVTARNAIGLAFEEMERKQARLVGTVTAMQSSLAELAFIDSREAELGLRRYKPGSPQDKTHRQAESVLYDSFAVVAPPDNPSEPFKQAVEAAIMRDEELDSGAPR
jgi:hypothetical protein